MLERIQNFLGRHHIRGEQEFLVHGRKIQAKIVIKIYDKYLLEKSFANWRAEYEEERLARYFHGSDGRKVLDERLPKVIVPNSWLPEKSNEYSFTKRFVLSDSSRLRDKKYYFSLIFRSRDGTVCACYITCKKQIEIGKYRTQENVKRKFLLFS